MSSPRASGIHGVRKVVSKAFNGGNRNNRYDRMSGLRAVTIHPGAAQTASHTVA
jgi:hypothetical protein